MNLRITYDQEFDDLLMHWKLKYPKALFDIDGIGKQTDMSIFSKDFFNTRTTTADVSVDDNSNVDDMSVIAYQKELPKPFFKLNSYYVLWKKLKQLYGKQKAAQIVEDAISGTIYINDFHGVGGGLAYCFNYSTFDILLHGLPMIKKIKSVAPKYLSSFKSQLEQFVTIASNSTLGAAGLADVFIVMTHYIDNILATGHDSGVYFDGWHSDADQAKIVEDMKAMPIGDKYGKNDLAIMKATEKIALKTGRTEPNNKEWFKINVWRYVSEVISSFIYTVNQPMRGNQSPFTNVSVYDDKFIDSLAPEYAYNGKEPSRDTVKRVQELFIDIMNAELKRTPVTFPVTTACFATEGGEILDENFLMMISEKNLKYGFINLYCGSTSTLSSCCRLRSDKDNQFFKEQKTYEIELEDGETINIDSSHALTVLDKTCDKKDRLYVDDIIADRTKYLVIGDGAVADLRKPEALRGIRSIKEQSERVINKDREYSNSIGGGSSKIGSLGVATVNIPRIAYQNRGNSEEFFEALRKVVNDCARINNAKRKIVEKRIENGNHPLYTLGFLDLKKQYSTTGVNGLNESVEIMGLDVLTDQGQEFVLDILNVINDCNDRNEKLYNYPHNSEQIPGESASVKLATKDKLLKVQDPDLPYDIYSNQFIPLTTKADVLDRIKLQGKFDKHFSGGAIMHLNVDEQMTNAEDMASLIKECAKRDVVYFAINYKILECENGHMSVGDPTNGCQTCGKPIVNEFTRVIGYLVCTKSFNETRRRIDYPNRQFYDADNIADHKEHDIVA